MQDINPFVHLDGSIGRTAICAEAIAIGRMITDGDGPIQTIASIQRIESGPEAGNTRLVAPCGICREMLCDYPPEASVLLPDEHGSPMKLLAAALLPNRYYSADAPRYRWPTNQ